MEATAMEMTTEDETTTSLLASAVLVAFCGTALLSQLITCCIWGALSLFDVNLLEEE